MSNTPNSIIYGNFGGSAVTIDEPLVLAAGYELEAANPCEDLGIRHPGAATRPPGFCTIPGDVDFDAEVGFDDFLVLSANFGTVDAEWPDGHFDWDHEVAFSDFLLLSDNFGKELGNCPDPNLSGEFVNLNFEAFCPREALPGWSTGGNPFNVGVMVVLAARTRQIVVYKADTGVGGGYGLIPSIDGFSLYIDAAFGNDVSISQVGMVPTDARSLSLTVNEYHNDFEVQLGSDIVDLLEIGRERDTVDYGADVSSLAGQMLELKITAKVIDENDPLLIPDGPDAGDFRALVLDNVFFSPLPVPVNASPMSVPEPSGFGLLATAISVLTDCRQRRFLRLDLFDLEGPFSSGHRIVEAWLEVGRPHRHVAELRVAQGNSDRVQRLA